MISQVFSGRQSPSPLGADSSLAGSASDNQAPILLALRTLSGFDFSGRSLSQFALRCSDEHLHSEYPEIRLAAATTCCALVTPMLQVWPTLF